MSKSASEPRTTDTLLFVTASSATHKTINRFLTTFGDPSADEGADYTLGLVTHRDASLLANEPPVTKPGDVKPNLSNPWAGASISDVEKIAIQAPVCVHSGLVLILDDEGVRNQTIIVAERAIIYVNDEQKVLDEWKKVRAPWLEAMPMVMNLWIANMDFEEYVKDEEEEEEEEGKRGGWFEWAASEFVMDDKERKEKKKEVEGVLKRLEGEGLA